MPGSSRCGLRKVGQIKGTNSRPLLCCANTGWPVPWNNLSTHTNDELVVEDRSEFIGRISKCAVLRTLEVVEDFFTLNVERIHVPALVKN